MTTDTRTAPALCAANDNGASAPEAPQVVCDLPDALGIIGGEVDLLVRYLGDIEAMSAANDNDPEIP